MDIIETLRVAGLSLGSLYSWDGAGATTQDQSKQDKLPTLWLPKSLA